VNVARTKRASFEVSELVEHEERVVAGAAEVAIPNTLLLFAVCRAHARIHVQHDLAVQLTFSSAIDPVSGQVGKSGKIRRCGDPLRFKAAHLAR
jgi:hypothetical protein